MALGKPNKAKSRHAKRTPKLKDDETADLTGNRKQRRRAKKEKQTGPTIAEQIASMGSPSRTDESKKKD